MALRQALLDHSVRILPRNGVIKSLNPGRVGPRGQPGGRGQDGKPGIQGIKHAPGRRDLTDLAKPKDPREFAAESVIAGLVAMPDFQGLLVIFTYSYATNSFSYYYVFFRATGRTWRSGKLCPLRE
jgi:hypothetical protein